jgi:recombination protein RecR
MTAQTLAEPIARLIAEFGKLPTVGPKTAQRLTYFLLRQPAEEA